MKIAVAQLKCYKNDIQANINKHIILIKKAIKKNVDLIVFPELSITSYEPTTIKKYNFIPNDERLNIFQKLSDEFNISIGVGVPIKINDKFKISLVFFENQKERKIYSKQFLHQDEKEYFTEGNKQVYLNYNNYKIAPAICYESMLEKHYDICFKNGANIYLVSVAKSKEGVDKSYSLYPEIAKKYSSYVLMSNLIGESDNFINHGHSGIWDKNGSLLNNFTDLEEGILTIDLLNKTTEKVVI